MYIVLHSRSPLGAESPFGAGREVGAGAASRRHHARRPVAAEGAAIWLLLAPNPGPAGDGDRGRHALPAPEAPGRTGAAEERMENRGRTAAPLLRPQCGRRPRLQGTGGNVEGARTYVGSADGGWEMTPQEVI